MGNRKSKEFRKRMEVKEHNKNNWKNKVNPETSNVDFNKTSKAKKTKEKINTSGIEKMFIRKKAELADERRKEAYQKVVYEKIRQMEEEKRQKDDDFSR